MNAHRGDHDIAFYEAVIEETRSLDVTAAGEETPDDDGALTPGRYLVQFFQTSGPTTAICWLHVGVFKEGVLGPTAEPGNKRFPLSASSIIAIEFNVMTDENDRIAGIMSEGAGTLFISRVSTETRKHQVGA